MIDFKIIYWIFYILLFAYFFCDYRTIKKQAIKSDRNFLYLCQLLILIGVICRTYDLSFPLGLYPDEAINGYESWCLANFGVDMNTYSWPAYFKSTATGQSVLYAYIAMPFVKLWGLSPEVFRLPMALIGSITVVFFYWVLRQINSKPKLVFVLVSFLVINPWHIIKSRYAMDCNIFPELMFLGVCFYILTYYTPTRKGLYYLVGTVLIVIGIYGYGLSWFVVPVFLVLSAYYLYKNNIIGAKNVVVASLVSFVIALPLIIFTLVSALGLEQINLGVITIPVLDGDRIESTSILGTKNLQQYLIFTSKALFDLIFLGVDYLRIDSFKYFGLFYNIISIPFFIAGLYFASKEKQNFVHRVFFIWLVSCVAVVVLIFPSIWHWNALWFPVIYFTAYGIYVVATKVKFAGSILFVVYALAFTVFMYRYVKYYYPFESYMYKDEVMFANSLDVDAIYYQYDTLPHTLLFYAPESPYDVQQNLKKTAYPWFRYVKFSRTIVGYPEKIEPLPRTAYVVPKDILSTIDAHLFNVREGEYGYAVIWNE